MGDTKFNMGFPDCLDDGDSSRFHGLERGMREHTTDLRKWDSLMAWHLRLKMHMSKEHKVGSRA